MKAKYNIFSFLFIGILGTLSHFVYEWTGNNTIVGYFFAINESTWEHLKLLFFPTVLYSIIEYYFVKDKISNYASSIAISLFVGMLSIVTLFYTYSGVLGYTIDAINITIYYISLIIMLIVKNRLIKGKKFASKTANAISLLYLFIMALFFIFFTYNPPSINLFVSPV